MNTGVRIMVGAKKRKVTGAEDGGRSMLAAIQSSCVEMFSTSSSLGHMGYEDERALRLKIKSKISDAYENLDSFVPTEGRLSKLPTIQKTDSSKSAGLVDALGDGKAERFTRDDSVQDGAAGQLVVASNERVTASAKQALASTLMVPTATGGEREYVPSATIAKRAASKWPRPEWHQHMELYRVVSGHQGWVRCLAFDPSNEFFASGSNDRTIRIWDVASGQLRLTLTGHLESITGLKISDRSPYMFSCALDKQVKCWDLETNKVIRHYHGHLSAVNALELHPKLDVLATGGRDGTCRVWDIRTRVQAMALSTGDSCQSILMQGSDPQLITGSVDGSLKLWDLRTGKTFATINMHRKGIRALAMHPTEYNFASGAADNIKKWALPRGEFLFNFLERPTEVINDLCVNEDGVLASAGDGGTLSLRDWKSGNTFQTIRTPVQPGSLDAESGVMACEWDKSGTRLICGAMDKTIRFYRGRASSTPQSDPIVFKPPKR